MYTNLGGNLRAARVLLSRPNGPYISAQGVTRYIPLAVRHHLLFFFPRSRPLGVVRETSAYSSVYVPRVIAPFRF